MRVYKAAELKKFDSAAFLIPQGKAICKSGDYEDLT